MMTTEILMIKKCRDPLHSASFTNKTVTYIPGSRYVHTRCEFIITSTNWLSRDYRAKIARVLAQPRVLRDSNAVTENKQKRKVTENTTGP